MRVIRRSVQGKFGDPARCEDVAVATPRLAAVIDGVSSDGPVTLSDGTVTSSGRAAADAIAAALTQMAEAGPLPEPGRVVAELTSAVRGLPASPAGRRAAAAVTLVDPAARLVVRVGDTPFRVGSTVFAGRSAIDEVTVAARCAMMQALRASGADDARLRETDPGRALILPLLTVQHELANRPGPYGFAAVNGRPVPPSMVEVEQLPPGPVRVVLASDGYPDISGTFEQAELRLAALLAADPLCVGPLAGTKPVGDEMVSFDDRAWLELEL